MTNIAMENPNHKWRFRSLGKSNLFQLGPYLPWRTVSHNQRVMLRLVEIHHFNLADVHGFSVVVFHLWRVVDREIIPIIRLRISRGATPAIAGRSLRESAHGSESS